MKYKYSYIKKLDTFGIGAGVSGAMSAASSIYAADRQAEVTRETNEMNKQLAAEKNALDYQVFNEGNEFNRIEAEKSRAFNEEMQARQERFNSLRGQIKQAQDANINPAAVAGGLQTTVGSQSGAQAVSEPVPSFAAAHMQTPDLSALQGLSQAFGNFASAQLSAAQAGKVKAETSAQWTLNKWIDKEKEAGLKLTRSESAKNFATVKHLNQMVQQSKEEVNSIRASIALTNEQAWAQNIENAFKAPALTKQYDILCKEYDIKEQQAKRLVATFAFDVAVSRLLPKKLQGEIDLNYNTMGLNNEHKEVFKNLAELYKTQNDQASFDLGVDEDFKELEKAAGLMGPIIKLLVAYISKKR